MTGTVLLYPQWNPAFRLLANEQPPVSGVVHILATSPTLFHAEAAA
jgi:hypothetical protein